MIKLNKNLIMQQTIGTNIDDIKETGNYEIFNAVGTLPIGFSTSDNNIFIQQFMRGTDYGRQILYDVRTSRWCSRELLNNVWNNWVEESDRYSTDETIIGTYLGKPLYRKIIRVENLYFETNAEKYVPHNTSNVDQIVNVKYSGYFAGDGNWYTNWDGITNIKAGTASVVFLPQRTTTFLIFDTIIEYTKTTD